MHSGENMANILTRILSYPALKMLRDKGGYFAEVIEAYPPSKLMTNGDGDNARLRVDVGQTGFFTGREFRTFKEYALAGSQVVYLKVTTPIDLILEGIGLQVDDGYAKLEAFVGVTSPTGFSTALPVIGTNRMNDRPLPYYVSQVTVTEGTSFTGGTLTDVIRLNTSNNSNQSSTQDAVVAGERGVWPGDYYLKLTNLDSTVTTCIFRARWEERA